MLKFTTRKPVKADFVHRDFDSFKRIRLHSNFKGPCPMLSLESFSAGTISPYLTSVTRKLWCWYQLILPNRNYIFGKAVFADISGMCVEAVLTQD